MLAVELDLPDGSHLRVWMESKPHRRREDEYRRLRIVVDAPKSVTIRHAPPRETTHEGQR